MCGTVVTEARNASREGREAKKKGLVKVDVVVKVQLAERHTTPGAGVRWIPAAPSRFRGGVVLIHPQRARPGLLLSRLRVLAHLCRGFLLPASRLLRLSFRAYFPAPFGSSFRASFSFLFLARPRFLSRIPRLPLFPSCFTASSLVSPRDFSVSNLPRPISLSFADVSVYHRFSPPLFHLLPTLCPLPPPCHFFSVRRFSRRWTNFPWLSSTLDLSRSDERIGITLASTFQWGYCSRNTRDIEFIELADDLRQWFYPVGITQPLGLDK